MARVIMKRNLKSILKYLIFILTTIFLTIVVFKLLKQFNRYNSNDIHLEKVIARKQLYSNRTTKVDWHDWEFINLEKQRTGKIIISIVEYICNLFYYIDIINDLHNHYYNL